MIGNDRPVLITGGAGFIGSNLAHRLAMQGHRVIVLDSLARPGVEANLHWLVSEHGQRIEPVIADIRDTAVLGACVNRAGLVYHFAAQVAVTTSLADPLEDFGVNLGGTIAVLEAARARQTPVIFASTNKVYGDLGDIEFTLTRHGYAPGDDRLRRHGVAEDRALDFHTPYGCSKGGADQYVLDYARSFGVPGAVLRMSCIYGRRQMGTEDQGWVAHFLIRALQGEPITLFGDGEQVRDVLDVDDAVAAYVALGERIAEFSGRAFNLGGGPDNAVSLNMMIDHAARLTGRTPHVEHRGWRAGDQRWFVADTRDIRAALGLAPPRDWRSGVANLFSWLETQWAAPHKQPAAAL